MVWHRQSGMSFGISCFLLAFFFFFDFDIAGNNPLNGPAMAMINIVLVILFCFFAVRAVYFSMRDRKQQAGV